ncbi:MAG: leucine-rich repeat protein [Bacilli bacterium]
MKNKKAFTMVELLGVIIILSFITLVVTINIIKIQKDKELELFESSVNSIVRSAQMYYANNSFINYPISGIAANSSELDLVNNQVFTTGSIKLVDNEYFFVDNVSNGKFCAVGVRNDLTIINGTCPETPNRCFEFDSKTGTITKYLKNKVGCDISNPTVPSQINGVAVKNIGKLAFANYEYMNCSNNEWKTTVKVTNTSDIDKYLSCSASMDTFDKTHYFTVVSVSLPSTIEKIDDMAFSNNNITILNSSNLPSLKYIGNSAFELNNIISLNLSKNLLLGKIGDNAFLGNNISNLILEGASNLTEIGTKAFMNNKIETLNLSNFPLIKEIKDNTFNKNLINTLTIANIPNLEIIGESSFANNVIKNLTLENFLKLTTIKNQAFMRNSFSSVIIRNLPVFKTFGFNSFGLSAVNTLVIDNLPILTEIGESAFRDNNIIIKNMALTNLPSVTKIGNMTFHSSFVQTPSGTLDLTGMPNLEFIDYWAFNFNQFDNIIFNSNIKRISDEAFRGYGALKTTNLGELKKLEIIGEQTFRNNIINSLIIPENVNSIGNSAFFNSKELKSVTILGIDPKRFNTNWTAIGWPSSLKPL